MNKFISKYGEWALITGASKGIGLEFSRQIAAKGVNVPGWVNKFVYYSGKYLQSRCVNTMAFGHVFRKVLRNKLKGPEAIGSPRSSNS